MNQFEIDLGKWVVLRRWWLIAATLLAVVITASGMRFLTINDDLRIMFSEDNPQLQALEELENTYTRNETIFFAIAPKYGDIFTNDNLAAVEELTEAAWQMPFSSRVDSITNFQHTWSEEDDLVVEDLVQGATDLSLDEIQRIKAIALSEPLLVNRLVSPSGHVTGVSIIVLKPGEALDEVARVAAFSRALAEELRTNHPGVEVYLTGSLMGDNAFAEASLDDMTTLNPVMFVTLLVIVALTLRTVSGTIATFLVIIFSVVTAMGMAGWLGLSINPASAAAPLIIMTLAVADSVHILSTVLRHMRLGESKRQAIAEAVRVNLQPVILTSVTTAIGFMTMNFSDVPPFRELGNIVAIGVMAALVYSLFFLPALMSVLPMRPRLEMSQASQPCCNWLASFVIVWRKAVFWGMLATFFVLSLGTLRIELHDDWVKNFDERYDFRLATDFVQDNLTGFDVIEYSLESGNSGGINDPAYMATVEQFAKWYRGQPNVVHVQAITDTMKRLNMNMHGDDPSYHRIPEARDLAAQYLLLYEMSLPFGLSLNNEINIDKSATRMIVTMRGTTTRQQREMDDRARDWLQANAPQEMFTYGSGLTIIWAHISQRNMTNMLGASFGALVIISFILMAVFRSIKLGLVSLIPNLAPGIMAFGIWGLVVGQVGIGLSVIIAMTLGIVVDDTVHFLSKYLRAQREGNMGAFGAVRFAFDHVGTAMWVTTLALVCGFLIMTFSGYRMSSDMGVMTAITISLALVLDFLLLPVLLIMVEGTKSDEIDPCLAGGAYPQCYIVDSKG
jgi:predicted RND superfamily exporter protein